MAAGYPWQVELPNLPDIHARALQAQAMRLAMQEKQNEMELGRRRSEAVRAYQAGDPKPLQEVAPEIYQKFEALKLDQDQQKASVAQKQAEAAIKAKAEQVEMLARIAPRLAEQPAAGPAAMRYLSQLPQFEGEDLTWMQDPEQVKQMATMLPRLSQKFKEPEFEDVFMKVANGLGYGPESPKGSYGDAWNDPNFLGKYNAYLEAEKKGKAKGVGAQITITPEGEMRDPLTLGTRANQQKELIENEKMLNSLQAVKQLARPEFFSLMGRAKNWGSAKVALLDSNLLSKGATGDLEARQQLTNEVEQLFNDYRRLITGAAASVQELQSMRGSMFNMSLSWPQFTAGIKQFETKVSRTMRVYRRVLREGVDVTPEQTRERANALIRAGSDARTMSDIMARKKELLESGLSDVDVIVSLASEGYLTPEQAESAMEAIGQSASSDAEGI